METDRVLCTSGSGVIQMRPVEWLRDALKKKQLKRYGGETHLLVDNQGWASRSDDMALALGGEHIGVEGFGGVWFVSPEEGPDATLLLSAST